MRGRVDDFLGAGVASDEFEFGRWRAFRTFDFVFLLKKITERHGIESDLMLDQMVCVQVNQVAEG